ncbi:transposase [Arthrobacter sp. lap29]|uniref:transposase n=1 Tax=Arthrobacter sp. lap29 TaxID=3056122 RepID=UPI0028F6C0E2|nr:transposase [Arthrobacter sp. lap29]
MIGALAALEIRHRLRDRSEDIIRNANDTGLANLPFKSFAGIELWCHIVSLAAEILTWTARIAIAGKKARCWEPKKLQAKLFEIGGTIAINARQINLHLDSTAPDEQLLLTRLKRSTALSPT